jgi:hypothetical protein
VTAGWLGKVYICIIWSTLNHVLCALLPLQAARQLVHVAEQPAEPRALDTPAAGRTSGSTEALEGHLEETAAEVEQCMEVLTQVVGRARRASEVGLLASQGAPAGVNLRRFSQLDMESKPAAAGVPAGRSSDDSI